MIRLRPIAAVALLVTFSRAAYAQEEKPPDPPAAPAVPAAPAAPASRAQQVRRLSEQVAAQQATLEELTATVQRLEQERKEPKPPPPPATPPPVTVGEPAVDVAHETTLDARKSILVYGYVQGQFQTDQSSQNEIAQDGHPLNQNRFLIPRARLVVEREWKIAALLLELDGNTLNGPAFGLQRAEATILHRGSNAPALPPQLSVTVGQFRVPFGAENLESPAVRYFMERSLSSRAFFPSEIDLGLRVAGALDWFRYSVAATNGQPLGTRDFPLQDPDSAKDLVGRLGVDVKPADDVNVTAGFSSLVGKGFHREAAGIKSQIQWNDRNGDGIFQPEEVTGVGAVAARSSSTFRRFALAFDGKVDLRWRILGVPEATSLSGAFYLGNNMDRGLFFSDPVLSGRDTRHVGYALSLIQEVGDWGVVGFRADYYDPDSDASDFQNAKPVQPDDRSIRTYSPLVGLRYGRRARLLFQYDAVRDKLGRDDRGIPVDLKNDRMTVRLQVNL